MNISKTGKSLTLDYTIDQTFTPLDGRNRHKLDALAPFLSELALDTYRLRIEIAYFVKLSKYHVIRELTHKEQNFLEDLVASFSSTEYKKVREIELTVNHEMKALEMYTITKLKENGMEDIAEMIHVGLTADDINNIAYALMLKDSITHVLLPYLETIKTNLKTHAQEAKNLAMLGRTHGQPALPTTLGKEFLIYFQRISQEITILSNLPLNAKLTGNVGNLNAHKLLHPEIDWLAFSTEFIESFGLVPDLVTTQIEPYDSFVRTCQTLERINTILTGLCIDLWSYSSMGYFTQKVIKEEVGSTALPHKVNPIYLEGAEGGFGIANALFAFYTRKLLQTRFQRDLSDSTVRRSLGIALGYTALSYQSIIEALTRLTPNKENITRDLMSHWEILSEPIQNFLRTKQYTDAYDKTKQFFRGREVTQESVASFIKSLTITEEDKTFLLGITPQTYTGYAETLVDRFTE